MPKFETGGGDTGRMYEARFFGAGQVDPRFEAELRQLPPAPGRRFPKKEEMYDLFKKYYRGDPTNPPGTHARELRLAVADGLDLPEEKLDHVKLYSTLGSSIDRLLGVDGFIEYEDADKKNHRVTLDVTLRKQKQNEGHKADFIIGDLPDAIEQEDAYLKILDEYGWLIAKKLEVLSQKAA